MKKKSLGVNALLNGLRSALNLIFPLITFPYISRVLSVDGVGIYNFAGTYVNYFVLLAGLGVATYAVREGAKYRDDNNQINIFASQVFTINMVSTVIAYILLFISLLIFKSLNNYISAILIFSLQILFTTLGTEWIYTIYEDYSYITIRSIIFKILSIILLFILVRSANDYLWYAGITVFANVGSNIFNWIHAKSFINIKLVKNTNWKYHLKPILIIFASTIAITLYVSTDTTILGLLKNDYAVGIYSVAVKIYSIVSGLINGLLIVTIPRLAMLFGKQKFKEYKSVLSQVINNISVLMFPAAVGLIMLSKEVILIIAGKKYVNSILSLQIITVALIFSNFSTIFNQCILIPAKRENKTLRNTIVTGVVNVILNFVVIPVMSYNGTALTTVIAEFMIMTLNCWSGWDIVGDIIKSRIVVKNIVSSFIGCMGIVITCLVCKWLFTSIISTMIMSIVLSVIVYALILLILRNNVALEIINQIKRRLKE